MAEEAQRRDREGVVQATGERYNTGHAAGIWCGAAAQTSLLG
jgi:hypothetical protein